VITALLLVGLCFRAYSRWARSLQPPRDKDRTEHPPQEGCKALDAGNLEMEVTAKRRYIPSWEGALGRLHEKPRLLQLPRPLSREGEQLFYQQVQEEKASLAQGMQAIDQLFQIPCVQNLVTTIQNRPIDSHQSKDADTNPRQVQFLTHNLVAILLVILGIKPVVTFNSEDWDKFLLAYSNFDEITAYFQNVKFVKERGYCYVVNESPLPIFDPRHYLLKCQSIAEEIVAYFPYQEAVRAQQRLSYLLGFGPTWEALFLQNIYRNLRMSSSQEYKPEHFQQLGASIKRMRSSDLPEIELGHSYHDQVVQGGIDTTSIESKLADVWLGMTGTRQVYDELSIQTTYFKQSCCLKKYVLIKLGFAKTSHREECLRITGFDCFLE
jgi:hypothetical protein